MHMNVRKTVRESDTPIPIYDKVQLRKRQYGFAFSDPRLARSTVYIL